MKVFTTLREIVVFTDKTVNETLIRPIAEDIRQFLSRHEKYDLETITTDTTQKAGKPKRR